MTEEDVKANSLYDYVRELAIRYYEYYETPMLYPAELPSIEKIKSAQIEVGATSQPLEEVSTPQEPSYPDGVKILEKILTGQVSFPFTREDYDNATAVLESLDAIGLDREKFWLALQFTYYWVAERNNNCVPEEPSVQDRILDLIESLKDDRTLVSIKRPGKRAYALDDPETRKCLIAMLEYGDAKYSSLHHPTYDGRRVLIHETPQDMKQRWWWMDMYKALTFLFDIFCTDKDLPSFASSKRGLRNKTLLISRLIYLTRLTEDERFLDAPDILKLALKDCRENPRPMMDSGLFY